MSAEFSSAASRLCAACGMCCDGVLFHAVVLQAGDSERGLSALGFKIKRRGGPPHFLQPCMAHRDSQCAIYEQRPARCRLFNCRQLLRLETGEITEAVALEKIHDARRRVARVNTLIHSVAETNPNRGLAQRCANALTTDEITPTHRELEAAMRDLELLLEADFRVP
jgi:Fe-S-cluster containining protein